MDYFWFFMTLILDIIPFMVLSIFVLKKYLPCSVPVAIMKTVLPMTAWCALICITYMKELYGAEVMVIFRVLGIVPAWILMCLTIKRFVLPMLCKCFFTVPYMLGILQISAFCLNFIDTSNVSEFMAISCLRVVFYLILGYPYYLIEKKFLISNFEVENNKVWKSFLLSQLTLDVAMMFTMKTDYAQNGIEPKAFAFQIVMIIASVTVSIIMYYGFQLSRDIEIAREKQMRDELIIELNSKQYNKIQSNIEQMKRVRHDIRQHIHVMEQLIEEKKYDEVRRYLKEYDGSIPEGVKIKFCENLSINALIGYYYSVAEEKHISVQFDVAALAYSNVDDIDMNILLGNAIENAMDACQRLPEDKRRIKLCVRKMGKQIFITIDNQFDGYVKDKHGSMLSGKRNYEKPGYGNASMDAVTAKYNGQIKREVNGDRYQVSIVLKDRPC